MKKELLTILAVLSLGIEVNAQFIQSDYDGAAADTLDMVSTTSFAPGTGQPKLRLDVYVYNDGNTVMGATMGFCWSNPKLRMDSAVASPLFQQAFDYGRYFYYGNSLALTNTNRKFILGGVTMAAPAMEPVPYRQKWASFYFTMTTWSSADSVIIDTVTFNPGSKLKFVTTEWQGYKPYWIGRQIVTFGCCLDRTGNVDGDPQDVCDVSDLTALIDYLWISLIPPACIAEANCDGSTDGIVDISDFSALYDYLFSTFVPPALCR